MSRVAKVIDVKSLCGLNRRVKFNTTTPVLEPSRSWRDFHHDLDTGQGWIFSRETAMPRHTGRRLNSKARRRRKEVEEAFFVNVLLKTKLALLEKDMEILSKENIEWKREVRKLKDDAFTGGKEVTLALRKHYEQNGPRRRMVLSVVLDVESLRSDLYMSPAYFTDGRHIAHKLSREIEVGVVKLIEDEVLFMQGRPNG